MAARWMTTTPPQTPEPPQDPYLRWARHTDWRGMRGQAGWDLFPDDDAWVQIIARADDLNALDGLLQNSKLRVAPSYEINIPGTRVRALHFTARVLKDDLRPLAEARLPMRWELSQPLRDAEVIARGSAVGRFGALRNLAAFAAPNLLARSISGARRKQEKAELLERAIGVIDFGCPFLNERFADADGVTRVARLWDQGGGPLKPDDRRAAHWPWSAPWVVGYGREIGPALMRAMSSRVLRGKPALDETEAYRGIDYLIVYDDPRRRIWYGTHGGHVLDVAAGTADPLGGPDGPASTAPIVFVQLPSMTAADSSGASLGAHLLDGVRYVLHQCRDGAPVAVNISYGSYAGPHNGTSLVESAFDELLDARPDDFAIVMAAGNARTRRCHVKRTVRRDRSAVLRCQIGAGDTTDTFVEGWYQPPPKGWKLQARTRGPGRDWSQSVASGAQTLLTEPPPPGIAPIDAAAMLRHDDAPPNARHLGLVLLALAPTERPADVPGPLAEAGRWEVELSLVRDGRKTATETPEVEVNAWIERDDPGQNAGAMPHDFADQDADDDENTLNSLATGEHTIVVGGFRQSDGSACDYSSIGMPAAATAKPPMVLAACEEDAVNPGILAGAVRSGEVWRMDGTSVAAPVVTRRLFDAMVYGGPIGRADWGDVLDDLAAHDPCVRRPTADD